MMQLEYKENLILTNGSNLLVMKQKHILRSLIRCYVFCRPCILDHVISSLELFLSTLETKTITITNIISGRRWFDPRRVYQNMTVSVNICYQ